MVQDSDENQAEPPAGQSNSRIRRQRLSGLQLLNHESSSSSDNIVGTTGQALTRPQHKTKTDCKVRPKSDCHQAATHDSGPLLTASDYKNAGNKMCSLYRYDEALAYYSKAILKNPEVSIFFSNRALCRLKLQQWSLAIQDCRRALELDPNLIKAHFFLGQALAETGNYDDALKHLQRAHELAREKKMNFGDDIAYQIRLIKRHRWNKIEEETERLEDELRGYLLNLIERDRNEKLNALKNIKVGESSSGKSLDVCRSTNSKLSSSASSSSSSLPPPPPPSSSTWQPCPANSSAAAVVQVYGIEPTQLEEAQLEAQELEIKSKCDNYIDKLDTMFNDSKSQRKKRDVPDYLCGKISFEIMHDPVITPSGITYDRQDIEEHLKRVGHFDPITRQSLQANQLISNLAMKEVVDAYLSENEWALYY